jgi:hypothetical protein
MMRTAGGASAFPRQCHRQTWGKSNNSGIEIVEGLAEQSICRARTRSGLYESAREANVNVSFSVEPRTVFSGSVIGFGVGTYVAHKDRQKLPSSHSQNKIRSVENAILEHMAIQ